MNRTGGILLAAAAIAVAVFVACAGGDSPTYSPTDVVHPVMGGGGGGGGSGGGGAVPNDTPGSGPCLGGGNVLFFHGADGGYIWNGYNGDLTVTAGTWSYNFYDPQSLNVHVVPADAGTQGLWWDSTFSTKMMGDAGLAVGSYPDAGRWPFQDAGAPGLDVTGDGRGCNMSIGKFVIDTFAMNPVDGGLGSITASFLQYCENNPANWLQGCVNYTAP